jgi:hypothetical protein
LRETRAFAQLHIERPAPPGVTLKPPLTRRISVIDPSLKTPYLAMSRERHHNWLDAKLRKDMSAPGQDASPADRMAHRLQTSDGGNLYSKRKSTVETTFGILKSAMGFRSFLLRGLQKVEGEFTLVCTAYNLKRLYSLVAACPTAQVSG